METITGNIYYITTKLMNLPKEEKEKIFDLSEHKEKRSLSQNAYAWKLINEIANKVNLSKEEVHLNMLKHYSQVEQFKVLSSVDVSKYDLYFEKMCEKGGYTYYKVYTPSHNMNTKEMSIYLDGIIQEAENLGIPTLSEEEIERMKLI